jgi:hypothetical protein
MGLFAPVQDPPDCKETSAEWAFLSLAVPFNISLSPVPPTPPVAARPLIFLRNLRKHGARPWPRCSPLRRVRCQEATGPNFSSRLGASVLGNN